MGESRAAAEAAKAGRLDPFSEALGLVKDADSLLTAGAYARAAQKFLGARDGFERARRLAQR